MTRLSKKWKEFADAASAMDEQEKKWGNILIALPY